MRVATSVYAGGRDENYATDCEAKKIQLLRRGSRASSRSVTRAPKGCLQQGAAVVDAAATELPAGRLIHLLERR